MSDFYDENGNLKKRGTLEPLKNNYDKVVYEVFKPEIVIDRRKLHQRNISKDNVKRC